MSDVRRLSDLGMVPALAKEVAKQINAGPEAANADNVAVGAITSVNFTFAGGTLTQALQALADAIPAS